MSNVTQAKGWLADAKRALSIEHIDLMANMPTNDTPGRGDWFKRA